MSTDTLSPVITSQALMSLNKQMTFMSHDVNVA
jgi:hypothetical protein